MSTDRQDPGKAGSETARQIISTQAAAGMDADRIAEHHQEVGASLLCGAETPDGEAVARAYDGTAETLIGELREMERGPEPSREPGSPHPDPRLAAHGWRTCEHGIYVRRQAQAQAEDPEAA